MWYAYAVTAGALVVVAVVGGRATEIGPWYRELDKPSWTPPDWAFPVVWTTIYLFIIASIGMAWNSASPDQRVVLLVLVSINLVLNMLWSILFFTLKRPDWALVEVVLLWLSIAALVGVIQAWNNLAALLLLPYLIWTSIASALNLSIVRRNRDGGSGDRIAES